MHKEKRGNLSGFILILIFVILVIIAILSIIIYKQTTKNKENITEEYTIIRIDNKKIENNLSYSDTIIYVIDDFMYNGYVWVGGIVHSTCDIKIYADGRVIGEGYYCTTDKNEIKESVKFKLKGVISEEDTLALCELINNKNKE